MTPKLHWLPREGDLACGRRKAKSWVYGFNAMSLVLWTARKKRGSVCLQCLRVARRERNDLRRRPGTVPAGGEK